MVPSSRSLLLPANLLIFTAVWTRRAKLARVSRGGPIAPHSHTRPKDKEAASRRLSSPAIVVADDWE
jgi:hypothetical protein